MVARLREQGWGKPKTFHGRGVGIFYNNTIVFSYFGYPGEREALLSWKYFCLIKLAADEWPVLNSRRHIQYSYWGNFI